MSNPNQKGAGFDPSVHNRLYGGMLDPGGQWRESRGLTRALWDNPWAQEVLVRYLAGLWKVTAEGLEPNISIGPDRLDLDAARDGLRETIRFMRERFPEWASLDPTTVDSELVLPDYPGCDPEVKSYIEITILSGEFDRGGVE